jgi:hypothetical protein
MSDLARKRFMVCLFEQKPFLESIRNRGAYWPVLALVAAALLMLASAAGPPGAHAQTIKKGAFSGRVVSGRVEAPAPFQTTALPAPATGYLIVTQACIEAGQSDQATRLEGTTFGLILESSVELCRTFEPGLAMPSGDDVVCRNAGIQAGLRQAKCLVTAVAVRK